MVNKVSFHFCTAATGWIHIYVLLWSNTTVLELDTSYDNIYSKKISKKTTTLWCDLVIRFSKRLLRRVLNFPSRYNIIYRMGIELV